MNVTRVENAAKAKQLHTFFARYGRIYIVVNATLNEVQIPEHLRGDPALRLVLNTRMPQPIYIRDDSVTSDFSFAGQVTTCCIPMYAIWAAYVPEQSIEQGLMWEADIPEILRNILTPEDTTITEKNSTDGSPKVGDFSDATQEAPPPGRKVGHLRVVK